MNRYQAIGPNIIIKTEEVKEKYDSGLYKSTRTINAESYESVEGYVVHMGGKAFDYIAEEDRPKVGDIVIFKKFTGLCKIFDNKEYRIVSDEEVFAVLRGDDLTALARYVIIKVDKPPAEIKGIIVPESSLEKDQLEISKGEIYALGEEAFDDYADDEKLKVGQTVIFKKGCGIVLEKFGEFFRIMNDEDIIIREDKENV